MTILLCITLGTSLADESRLATVVGRITEDGRPVRFAQILVEGTRIGVEVDSTGWYRLEGVPPEHCRLQIRSILCEPKTLEVATNPGTVDTIDVTMTCPGQRCGRASKTDVTEECMFPNPREHARVGTRCSAHPSVRLAADTVRVSYGLQIAVPELQRVERDSFPNARLDWDGGCVISPETFTEVAFCHECRRVLEARNRRGGRR